MDKVGNAIKERRRILKITQRTLAELAGVGINTLTKIERGEGNPTIEVLEKILDTLGLNYKSESNSGMNYETRGSIHEWQVSRHIDRNIAD